MIHIDRDRLDEYGRPIRPDQKWFTSARAARDSALREGTFHVVKRRIYAHDQVRMALEKIFHGKCAYCESEITGGSDWNVEHFRPKGRVAERVDHPGYYWLAYEWTNLYPSCPFCNQRRRDKPRWGDLRLAGIGGKGDRFPLSDESTRAMSPKANLRREKTLLLDPCVERPEVYLSYTVRGHVLSRGNDLKSQVSIEVFHLNRRRLRDLRRKRIAVMIEVIRTIRRNQTDNDSVGTNKVQKLLQTHFLSDECPYAGAARAVAEDPDAFGI